MSYLIFLQFVAPVALIGPDIGVDKITAQQYRPRRCRFSQREQIDRETSERTQLA